MATIEHLRKKGEVNLVQLEADISAAARSGRSLTSVALPEYVEHQEGVTRVGALSAEAVVRDYESAAREIEAMGAELIEAARKCEDMTAQVHDAIAFMRETAAGYREQAKKIFRQIETCALFTEEVRKTCEQVTRRMVDLGTSRDDDQPVVPPAPAKPD